MVPDGEIWVAWNSRKKPCPGKESVRLPDLALASLKLTKRVLYFAITVESAKNCSCTVSSMTVYAKQTLESDGNGGVKVQKFGYYRK